MGNYDKCHRLKINQVWKIVTISSSVFWVMDFNNGQKVFCWTFQWDIGIDIWPFESLTHQMLLIFLWNSDIISTYYFLELWPKWAHTELDLWPLKSSQFLLESTWISEQDWTNSLRAYKRSCVQERWMHNLKMSAQALKILLLQTF